MVDQLVSKIDTNEDKEISLGELEEALNSEFLENTEDMKLLVQELKNDPESESLMLQKGVEQAARQINASHKKLFQTGGTYRRYSSTEIKILQLAAQLQGYDVEITGQRSPGRDQREKTLTNEIIWRNEIAWEFPNFEDMIGGLPLAEQKDIVGRFYKIYGKIKLSGPWFIKRVRQQTKTMDLIDIQEMLLVGIINQTKEGTGNDYVYASLTEEIGHILLNYNKENVSKNKFLALKKDIESSVKELNRLTGKDISQTPLTAKDMQNAQIKETAADLLKKRLELADLINDENMKDTVLLTISTIFDKNETKEYFGTSMYDQISGVKKALAKNLGEFDQTNDVLTQINAPGTLEVQRATWDEYAKLWPDDAHANKLGVRGTLQNYQGRGFSGGRTFSQRDSFVPGDIVKIKISGSTPIVVRVPGIDSETGISELRRIQMFVKKNKKIVLPQYRKYLSESVHGNGFGYDQSKLNNGEHDKNILKLEDLCVVKQEGDNTVLVNYKGEVVQTITPEQESQGNYYAQLAQLSINTPEYQEAAGSAQKLSKHMQGAQNLYEQMQKGEIDWGGIDYASLLYTLSKPGFFSIDEAIPIKGGISDKEAEEVRTHCIQMKDVITAAKSKKEEIQNLRSSLHSLLEHTDELGLKSSIELKIEKAIQGVDFLLKGLNGGFDPFMEFMLNTKAISSNDTFSEQVKLWLRDNGLKMLCAIAAAVGVMLAPFSGGLSLAGTAVLSTGAGMAGARLGQWTNERIQNNLFETTVTVDGQQIDIVYDDPTDVELLKEAIQTGDKTKAWEIISNMGWELVQGSVLTGGIMKGASMISRGLSNLPADHTLRKFFAKLPGKESFALGDDLYTRNLLRRLANGTQSLGAKFRKEFLQELGEESAEAGVEEGLTKLGKYTNNSWISSFAVLVGVRNGIAPRGKVPQIFKDSDVSIGSVAKSDVNSSVSVELQYNPQAKGFDLNRLKSHFAEQGFTEKDGKFTKPVDGFTTSGLQQEIVLTPTTEPLIMRQMQITEKYPSMMYNEETTTYNIEKLSMEAVKALTQDLQKYFVVRTNVDGNLVAMNNNNSALLFLKGKVSPTDTREGELYLGAQRELTTEQMVEYSLNGNFSLSEKVEKISEEFADTETNTQFAGKKVPNFSENENLQQGIEAAHAIGGPYENEQAALDAGGIRPFIKEGEMLYEIGKDGQTKAGIGNYTTAQLKRKLQALDDHGRDKYHKVFKKYLLFHGYCGAFKGLQVLDSKKATDLLTKELQENLSDSLSEEDKRKAIRSLILDLQSVGGPHSSREGAIAAIGHQFKLASDSDNRQTFEFDKEKALSSLVEIDGQWYERLNSNEDNYAIADRREGIIRAFIAEYGKNDSLTVKKLYDLCFSKNIIHTHVDKRRDILYKIGQYNFPESTKKMTWINKVLTRGAAWLKYNNNIKSEESLGGFVQDAFQDYNLDTPNNYGSIITILRKHGLTNKEDITQAVEATRDIKRIILNSTKLEENSHEYCNNAMYDYMQSPGYQRMSQSAKSIMMTLMSKEMSIPGLDNMIEDPGSWALFEYTTYRYEYVSNRINGSIEYDPFKIIVDYYMLDCMKYAFQKDKVLNQSKIADMQNQLGLEGGGKLYRGLTFDSEADLDSFLEKIKDQQHYVNPQVSSTSLDPSFVKKTYGQSVIFEIENAKGVFMAPHSDYVHEMEVSIAKGERFAVGKIEKRDGVWHISLTQESDGVGDGVVSKIIKEEQASKNMEVDVITGGLKVSLHNEENLQNQIYPICEVLEEETLSSEVIDAFFNKLMAVSYTTTGGDNIQYFKNIMDVTSGVRDKGHETIFSHTKLVMKNFESNVEFDPNLISKKDFRILLLIHDIAKGLVLEKLGDLGKQHDYVHEVTEIILKKFPLSNSKSGEIITKIIADDYLGKYIQGYSDASHVQEQIQNISNELQVEPEDFYKLLKMFYVSDAGAYQKIVHDFGVFDDTGNSLSFKGKAADRIATLDRLMRLKDVVELEEDVVELEEDVVELEEDTSDSELFLGKENLSEGDVIEVIGSDGSRYQLEVMESDFLPTDPLMFKLYGKDSSPLSGCKLINDGIEKGLPLQLVLEGELIEIPALTKISVVSQVDPSLSKRNEITPSTPGRENTIMKDLEDTGENPGGTQGCKKYKNPKTGEVFYVKTYANSKDRETAKDRCATEFIANQIYNELGVLAAKTQIVHVGAETAIVSSKVEGELCANMNNIEVNQNQSNAFVIDAWLANRDVTGTGFDNLIVTENGNIVRIDNGGSLGFRAMGEVKKSFFESEVAELQTMRNPKTSPYAAQLFADISDQDIIAGVQHLVDNMSDMKIIEMVESSGISNPTAVADALIRRKYWLQKNILGSSNSKNFKVVEKTKQKKYSSVKSFKSRISKKGLDDLSESDLNEMLFEKLFLKDENQSESTERYDLKLCTKQIHGLMKQGLNYPESCALVLYTASRYVEMNGYLRSSLQTNRIKTQFMIPNFKKNDIHSFEHTDIVFYLEKYLKKNGYNLPSFLKKKLPGESLLYYHALCSLALAGFNKLKKASIQEVNNLQGRLGIDEENRGFLYRNLNFQSKEDLNQFLSYFEQVGSNFVDEGFFSTSVLPTIDMGGLSYFHKVMIMIEGVGGGVDATSFSAYVDAEGEILFSPGTNFKVKTPPVQDSDGTWIIHLTL